jgi:hypothetical protein
MCERNWLVLSLAFKNEHFSLSKVVGFHFFPYPFHGISSDPLLS